MKDCNRQSGVQGTSVCSGSLRSVAGIWILTTLPAMVFTSTNSERAYGTPSTFLAPTPISPEAVAADPALANYQTWDLKVNVPAGENWGYTGFLAQLTRGRFYNPPAGADWPQPLFWSIFPQLRYDTFVTTAATEGNDATFGPPEFYSGYPEFPAPIEFADTKISVVYLTDRNRLSGPGIFTIARLTFTNDTEGTIHGFTAGRLPNTPPVDWSFPLPVPEPTGAIAILGLTWLCTRRHTTRR